jgi:adhesin transport system outer membrane protein
MKNIILIFLCLNLYGFSLKEGLNIALDKDPDVRVKNNALQMILHDIDAAVGLNYPKFDFSSTVQREKLQGSEISANDYNRRSYDWAFIFTQPIYDGQDAKYEELLQKARYESAKYYLLESANSVALKYIEAYLNVLREKSLLKLTEESYVINKEIYNKNQIKYTKGISTRLEYERAKAKFEESMANNAIQDMNYKEAVITLRQYLQKDVDVDALYLPTFTFTLPPSYEAALKEASYKHPSLKVSGENIQVAMYEHERDRKRFKPTVNLVARYGNWDEIPALEQTKDDYSIGLQFKYNFYNGGRDTALDLKAQKNIDEKRILEDKSLQQIDNRLRLAWNAYESNSKKINQISTYTQAKETVLKTTFQAYEMGTIDLNLLLTTEDEYITSKKTLINANNDLLLSKYRIHEGIGDIVELIMTHTESSEIKKRDWDDALPKTHIIPDSTRFQALDSTINQWGADAQKQCYEIIGTTVNIRKAATTQSEITNTLHKGEIVCGGIREANSPWIKLEKGWISSVYAKTSSSPKSKN